MAFRKLVVWQRGMEMVKEAYRLTSQIPSEEKFGLVSQMRRAAVSVPSNIAEGYKRGGDKELKQFLLIARGSLAELQTQTILAQELFKLRESGKLVSMIEEVQKLLEGFIRRL